MLSLEEIKVYLRVDEEEEDSLLLQLEKFSREDIENATGVSYLQGENLETYRLAQLVIINDRYENRGSQDLEFKSNNILSSLFTKLKYSEE
ncbi:MAG: head-tail connector protein [Fusobacteriaceae bacterium]